MREGESGADRRRKLGAVAARAQQPDRRQGTSLSAWRRRCKRMRSGKSRVSSSSSSWNRSRKSSSSATFWRRRSAYEVTGSVPGARPMPRSIRPGNSASSILKRSATISGAWFGSITPPEPTRMRSVMAAICADHDVGRRARDRGQIVMLGEPIAGVAEAVGKLREIEAILERRRAGRRSRHRREIENRKRDHGRDLVGNGALGHPARTPQRKTAAPDLQHLC